MKRELPQAHLSIGDIYHLEYPKNFFNVCLLMETIEHLEEPAPALAQIFSVLAPGAVLLLSFPNYLSLPWLPFRGLVRLLRKPEWLDARHRDGTLARRPRAARRTQAEVLAR